MSMMDDERGGPVSAAPADTAGLATLIRRGGVYSALGGNSGRGPLSPAVCIGELVGGLRLPAGLDSGALFDAVLEREELMTTAIGQGIALPHPRTPLLTDPAEQFVAVAFPAKPVNWKALDGKPVHTVFLIVSASAKLHLRTLSKISFLCQQEDFRAFLARRPPAEEIIRYAGEAEAAWG